MPSEKSWENYRSLLARCAPGAVHEQYFYADTLKEMVKPNMVWLDAGCGHNILAPWIKDAPQLENQLLSTATTVVGCDVDPVSLNQESRIRRVACNLEQLSFAD